MYQVIFLSSEKRFWFLKRWKCPSYLDKLSVLLQHNNPIIELTCCVFVCMLSQYSQSQTWVCSVLMVKHEVNSNGSVSPLQFLTHKTSNQLRERNITVPNIECCHYSHVWQYSTVKESSTKKQNTVHSQHMLINRKITNLHISYIRLVSLTQNKTSTGKISNTLTMNKLSVTYVLNYNFVWNLSHKIVYYRYTKRGNFEYLLLQSYLLLRLGNYIHFV